MTKLNTWRLVGPFIFVFSVHLTAVACFASDSECQIVPCHGLNLSCKRLPKNMTCIKNYVAGDACRKFAHCEEQTTGAQSVVDSCVLVETPQFTQCKRCVEQCQAKQRQESYQGHRRQPPDVDCESQCL